MTSKRSLIKLNLLFMVGLIVATTVIAQQRRRSSPSRPATPPASSSTAQFKTCPVCNGSGKTHEHVAKYEEVRCNRCAGKGDTICDGTWGAPHDYSSISRRSDGVLMACRKCNGTGRMLCPVCDGSGTRRVDKGDDVTNVCYNCKGSGRVQMTREEIRAEKEARLEAERRKEEAKLEAERERVRQELRAKEEARLEAERVERVERERARLEAEKRRVEEARKKELEDARAKLKSAIASANSLTPSLKNSIGMELILIKPGEFRMGSDPGVEDEKPVHEVVILKPFYLGKYEVIQAEWRAVMGNNPSWFKGDNLPVEGVSFDEAKEFCRKLSQMTGEEYRLPSEAEWEYACRAGTTGEYAGDLASMAWYSGDSSNRSNRTHAVGTKQPNAWGLYDMHGNVQEWCQDWYSASYYNGSPLADPGGPSSGSNRVLRGGGWNFNAGGCRAASRRSARPDDRDGYRGFRVVRMLR